MTNRNLLQTDPIVRRVISYRVETRSKAAMVYSILFHGVALVFILALFIVTVGILVFALVTQATLLPEYLNLVIPSLLAIVVAAIPIGLAYGFTSYRRLCNHLSGSGVSFAKFASMHPRQQRALLERIDEN